MRPSVGRRHRCSALALCACFVVVACLSGTLHATTCKTRKVAGVTVLRVCTDSSGNIRRVYFWDVEIGKATYSKSSSQEKLTIRLAGLYIDEVYDAVQSFLEESGFGSLTGPLRLLRDVVEMLQALATAAEVAFGNVGAIISVTEPLKVTITRYLKRRDVPPNKDLRFVAGGTQLGWKWKFKEYRDGARWWRIKPPFSPMWSPWIRE